MAELKKKEIPTTAPAPAPKTETLPVPLEIESAQGGIKIKIEGDFVTLQMNQYIAEHIGQFRSCDVVKILFKAGSAPDITAYKNG